MSLRPEPTSNAVGSPKRLVNVPEWIEDDAGLSVCPAEMASHQTYFRVVKRRPGDWHVLPMSAAAGQRMGSQDIVVSMCPVQETTGRSLFIGAESPERAMVMKDFFGLPTEDLESELFCWQGKLGLSFRLPLIDLGRGADATELETLLQALVLPQAEQCFTASQKLMLEDLQAKGLASSTASENGSRCSLTALGQALLSTQRCLDNPQLVSEIRQAGLPLHDRRIYELLKLLQAGGWRRQALPSTAKKRSELQYDVNGGEKVFYTGLLPVKPYLACLLRAESLRAELGIAFILHWVPATCSGYYKALLDGDREKAEACLAPRPAVEDDGSVLPLDFKAAAGSVRARAAIADVAALEPLVADDGCESDVESLLGLLASDAETPAASVNPLELAVPAKRANPEERPPAKRPKAKACKVITPVTRFSWGCFKFTPKHSAQGVQWEATCPFHRKNMKTGCKKLVSASRAGSAAEAIHRLKYWRVQAMDHDRQRNHMFGIDLMAITPLPPLEELEEAVLRIEAPAAVPCTDEDLDSRAPANQAPGARAPPASAASASSTSSSSSSTSSSSDDSDADSID